LCPKVTTHYKTELRSKIIEAAAENFSRSGFDRTKMEDIARTMNLSKGTIYLYFKSKEDLFYALCEYKLEELKRQLSMLFKKKEDLISDAGVFYDNYRRAESGSERVFFEMIAESTRNPKIKSILQEHRKKIHEVVVQSLELDVQRGFFDHGMKEVQAIASGLISLYDGLMLAGLLGSSEQENKRAWLETVRAIVSGLTKMEK
jgi:AcrR family transcriptional regulator